MGKIAFYGAGGFFSSPGARPSLRACSNVIVLASNGLPISLCSARESQKASRSVVVNRLLRNLAKDGIDLWQLKRRQVLQLFDRLNSLDDFLGLDELRLLFSSF